MHGAMLGLIRILVNEVINSSNVSRLTANCGQFGGMGERLIFNAPGNEWNDFADIEGGDSSP